MRTAGCLVNVEDKVRTVLPAVRNPARARNFLLSKTIQTRSRAHTVPCSMRTWAPSLKVKRPNVISGFRSEVAENFALLCYYATSSGKFLTDVSGQPFDPNIMVQESRKKKGFLNLDGETDRLSRNVGRKLPLLAA